MHKMRKNKIFTTIPLNLLLRGGDDWNSNKEDVKKIEAFQNKAVRRILRMTMSQVKEDRIHNDEIRSKLNKMPKAEEIWRNC